MQFERVSRKKPQRTARVGCFNTAMLKILNVMRDVPLTKDDFAFGRSCEVPVCIHIFYCGASLYVGSKHHEFFIEYHGEHDLLRSSMSELWMLESMVESQKSFESIKQYEKRIMEDRAKKGQKLESDTISVAKLKLGFSFQIDRDS